MDREGHEDTRFFIGTEVEHTPAYGQRDFVCSWVSTQRGNTC